MDFDPNLVANGKIAAGALGGGVVRMFLRPARSLAQTALLLASCVTCGFYGTPPLVDYLHLPADYAGAVGALLGLVGLSVAEGVLKAVDRFDFARWLGPPGK